MSTPIAELLQWIQMEPLSAGYVPSRGAWVESDANADRRIVSLIATGGRTPGVIERYPQIRVGIFGRRGERNVAGAVADLEAFAEALMQRALVEFKSGCLTQIRPLGDITGPGYTLEDRPWYEINFEVIV